MRQIVLDTETTGLDVAVGHRVIEIGCVELVNRRPTRRSFHRYINPQRAVDIGALEIHGIDDDFLATQPYFEEVAQEFIEFVSGSELVIHNADFDVGFINHELELAAGHVTDLHSCCTVLDTLMLARKLHPGQRNSLDALAKRYHVDTSKRELHGALLDARILAEVYLAMTGGQVSLLPEKNIASTISTSAHSTVDREGLELTIIRADAEERTAHEAMLEMIRSKSVGGVIWDNLEESEIEQLRETV